MVMALVIPQTDLILLKCPLEVDQQNQLTFNNETAQYNYFNGLPKLVGGTDFTYQRKDGRVRFNADIEDIRDYNYCMYRNNAYSNKWFYAFITDMEYANDGVTFIKLKTDVWQSWMFSIEIKPSFVQREHVNDDSIGAHTLDEDLPTGEPIMNDFQDWIVASNDEDKQRVVAQVTTLPDGFNIPAAYETRVYNTIPQGCYFLVFNGPNTLQQFIKWYDKMSKRDAIVAVFLVPYSMVDDAFYADCQVGDIGTFKIGFLPPTYLPENFIFTGDPITYSSTLDGYAPKNNKMYCYPYSYLYVSNNAGTDVIYHYEDWQDPTEPYFSTRGVIGQGCSIQLFPYAYKKQSLSSGYGAYGISCAKLPILSWVSDYYLNWQAQNGVNNVINAAIGAGRGGLRIAGGALDLAGNMAAASFNGGSLTAAGAGSAITSMGSGFLDVFSSVHSAIHENYVAELVPNQAMGNTNCGDITYAMDKCGFTFRKMSCRYEYAVMIDNYFSMFGYKVNQVKVPNVNGRTNWNYVKCVQANILGNVPQADIEELKAIFNTGITFWHNPANYLDYSQTNAIV